MPTAGIALHIQEDVLMYRLLNKYLMFALLLGGAFSVHAAHAAPPQDLKGTNDDSCRLESRRNAQSSEGCCGRDHRGGKQSGCDRIRYTRRTKSIRRPAVAPGPIRVTRGAEPFSQSWNGKIDKSPKLERNLPLRHVHEVDRSRQRFEGFQKHHETA